MKKFLVVSVALTCLITCGASMNAMAQDRAEKGALGLSAIIQAGQSGIALPYWASKDVVIMPAFSVVAVSDVGTDAGVALTIRNFFGDGQMAPYLGFGAGTLFYSPDSGDSTMDWIVSGIFGGEYFFSPDFSAGVEAQINYVKSDEMSMRFGNPDGWNINTATAVMATIYF